MSIGVMAIILIVVLVASFQLGRRVIFQNQAQTSGPTCRNIDVDCIVGVPDEVDPADYQFEVCVQDNNNPQSFTGGCVTVNGTTNQISKSQLNGASSFRVRVPITSMFQSSNDIATTRLQCQIKVQKKSSLCEETYRGNFADLAACPIAPQQCDECKCVEPDELKTMLNNGAIRYVPIIPQPQPLPNACYGACQNVRVTRDDGRTFDIACEENAWIGEGGDLANRCVRYTFNKLRDDINSEVPHKCVESPDAEGCSREVCCQVEPEDACKVVRQMNTENPNLCAEEDCQFELVVEQSSNCPTCDGQLVLGIGQTVVRSLTDATRGSWDDFEFKWGRFGENFEPIPPGERVSIGTHYDRGGIYELTLRCKKGDEVLTCTKYVPVICATCGDQPSLSPTMTPQVTPTPTPNVSGTPTVTGRVPNSCPLLTPIDINFSLDCKDCVKPTP